MSEAHHSIRSSQWMENLQQKQKGQGKVGIFVAGDDNLQILSIKKI